MSLRSIEQSARLARLLGDETRLRLLLLLDSFDLSVAELTEITGLAQSRISTHLSKLRQAGMIEDRRRGASSRYSAVAEAGEELAVWNSLRDGILPEDVARDRERAREVLRKRRGGASWAESVAGQMELHYSPGRTWEVTAHVLLPLLKLGRVLDIAAGDGVLATLLARQARHVTCIDASATVVAAGRERIARHANAHYVQGDMHALPFDQAHFDQVFLLHALTYTETPEAVLSEVRRVLRPKGQVVIATLASHDHAATVAAYDHVVTGYTPDALKAMLENAGLHPQRCEISSREPDPPYFQVVTALASVD